MGKSIVAVRRDMLDKFLLVMPDGTKVLGASADQASRDHVLLAISGRAVPTSEMVVAIVETTEVDGRVVKRLAFEVPQQDAANG